MSFSEDIFFLKSIQTDTKSTVLGNSLTLEKAVETNRRRDHMKNFQHYILHYFINLKQ